MSVYGLSLFYSSLMGSPYVPTGNKIILDILKEVKFKRNGLFIELGSGDGRVSRIAVKTYQVKATGVDVNPLLIIWSNLLTKIQGINKNCHFSRKNIFDIDYSQADYLYIFLMPDIIKKLTPKLNRELKKGAIIISHGFPIIDFKNKLIKKAERRPFPTYYYKV